VTARLRAGQIAADIAGRKVRISRVGKTEIKFYPASGGGAEQRLPLQIFLATYSVDSLSTAC
jgi:hypothetical protein